jgi:transcriptional pleiotropic regulator of transition state genes
MRATGIVRKADELGRIVIPKETRELLFINYGDSLEIFIEDNTLFLKRYSPGCTFCGDMDNITKFKGIHICEECSKNLKSYFNRI